MKDGVRILALDDSSFSREDRDSLVVGVLGRKGVIEGVMAFRVEIDGSDSTDMIIQKVKRSRFIDQIRLIALQGISFGGLNIIDIIRLSKETGLPVVCIVRRKPHSGELKKAIKAVGKDIAGKTALLDRINKAAGSKKIGKIYVQSIGLDAVDVKKLGGEAQDLLRLAHIIANGIARGESKGRL
jgi:endonuclease V-like protein UPF0215 family